MVCSHCHGSGHTYRRCPTITPEEKDAKQKEIKEKKEVALHRRTLRVLRNEQYQQIERDRTNNNQTTQSSTQEQRIVYEVSNTTEYDMVLYWGDGMNEGDFIHRFAYVNTHSTHRIICNKNKHTIVAFPLLEVYNNGLDAISKIPVHLAVNSTVVFPYTSIFKIKLKNYDGTIIIIDSDYKPKKNELDQWKEFALKSKFLLDQIHKLTGGGKGRKEYENIEVFMDMVEDIEVPKCSEFDKEKAGVPSLLTNVT